MFSFIVAVLALALSIHGAPTVPPPPPVPALSNGPAIAAELKALASSNDKFNKLLTDGNGNLLTGDALRQRTVFDFNNQAAPSGPSGGSILLATVENFPILQGLGVSGAIAMIEPCGLNVPHWHNRANELITVVDGILDTGFVQENGFTAAVQTQLGKFQATVFPVGSIHYQQNPTCEPAVFVASLSSDDPGRSDLATNFWMLPSDVVNAALGFPETIGKSNIADWASALPPSLAQGVESCLQACGLS